MQLTHATQLALTGLLLALLPLSMVWVSSDRNKYRKLVWVTLFLTFDLIMFGAFTRLTDSGLGCPDWPGCYGHANPQQAHAQIGAAEAAMPTGPVTVVKAWIEMIHRYLAMTVGVLLISLMLMSWWRWLKAIGAHLPWWRPVATCLGLFLLLLLLRPAGPAVQIGLVVVLLFARGLYLWWKATPTETYLSPWLPTLLFIFVCLQGAFGAWTVTMKLQPVIVTTHLLLGMVLLSLLTWLAARQSEHAPVASAASSLRLPAAMALALLAVQIALGGWVSTNYATLACTDFPLCHGALWPDMDFSNGFTLWRELGKTAAGEYLAYPALTAIHWTHRSFAWIVIGVVAWLAHQALHIAGLRRTGRWLLIVIAVQFATGVSTVFFNWPLALAVLHNGGAALLVLLLTMVNYKTGLAAETVSNRAASQLSSADQAA